MIADFTVVYGGIGALTPIEYSISLAKHDWDFDFSDDPSVWARGNEQRKKLKAAQKELDADCAIWNFHAPIAYRIGFPL